MSISRDDLTRLAAEGRLLFGNPLQNLSPVVLAGQLAGFRAGMLREFARTAEEVEERDDLLASVIPKAKAAVARFPYEIVELELIPAEQRPMAAAQKAALEHFYSNLRATSASEPDELGGFSLLVRQMIDAKAKRYAVHFIEWQPGRDGTLRATFVQVPLWLFEGRSGPLKLLREPVAADGESLEPGSWLVTVGDGLDRAAAICFLFKRDGLHAWVNYCEKHGFPLALGKTSAAKDSPEWEALVEAVESIGEDWSAVVNEGASIELIEAKGTGQIPHPPLVERMDRALARIWRGADLGTMSVSGAGVGSNPQEGETIQLDLDVAAWVSETLQMKVDRLVIDQLFGEDAPALAYVTIASSPRRDVETALRIDQFLLSVGHVISARQAAERYARPLPAAGDELLKAPVAPVARHGAINTASPAAPAARRQLISGVGPESTLPIIRTAGPDLLDDGDGPVAGSAVQRAQGHLSPAPAPFL